MRLWFGKSIYVFIFTIFIMYFFFEINLLDILLLKNFDLIIFSILFFKRRKISIIWFLLYGILIKDFLFSEQFLGIATLQYALLYFVLSKTERIYTKQSFYPVWIGFSILTFFYMTIPFVIFYIRHGTMITVSMFVGFIKILVSTILWYPIAYYLIPEKKSFENSKFAVKTVYKKSVEQSV